MDPKPGVFRGNVVILSHYNFIMVLRSFPHKGAQHRRRDPPSLNERSSGRAGAEPWS